MTYEELINKYLEFERLGPRADKAAFDKIKERLGEYFADLAVAERYGAVPAEGVLARKSGVPIFDRVYELGNNKFLYAGAEDVIVIDAKFGIHPRSHSRFLGTSLVEGGIQTPLRQTPLPQVGQVEQLDANWIRYRIEELTAAEKESAKGAGRVLDDSLSQRVRRASDSGRLRVLEVRTLGLDLENGVVRGAHVEITDLTETVEQQRRTGARLIDETTLPARKESIDRLYLERSKIRLKALADTAKRDADLLKAAERKRDGARKALGEARRKLAELDTPTSRVVRKQSDHPRAKAKGSVQGTVQAKIKSSKTPEEVRATHQQARKAFEEAQKAAEQTQSEYRQAKKVAERSRQAKAVQEEAVAANEAAKQASTKARETAEKARREKGVEQIAERARKVMGGATPAGTEPSATSGARRQPAAASGASPAAAAHTEAPKPAAAGTASSTATAESRWIQSKAVGDKAVEMTGKAKKLTGEPATGTGPTTKGASAVEKASESMERIVPKAKQAAPLRSVTRLAMRGLRVVKIAGKITFGILRAFNPVLNLLLVKDGIDLLLSWAYRERIAERDEWRRISNFLSAPTVADRLPPFGINYVTGLGDAITASVGATLAGALGNRDHFLRWMEKWNTDELWSGFVYATVAIALERQRARVGSDDPHEYTYYLLGPYRIALSDTPPLNSKTERGLGYAGPTEPRNRRTDGQAASFEYDVEIAQLEVTYTFSTPVLTPFDFITARCNDLISEMILFLSRYDYDVVAALPAFVEVVPGVDVNLLESYDFSKTPIKGYNFIACLNTIRKATHSLSEHAPRLGDSRHQYSQTTTVGYARRLAILRDLYNPTKTTHPFRQISSMLGTMVPYSQKGSTAKPADPNLDYLTDDYLSEFAETIHKDLARAYKGCAAETTKQEYAYQGRPIPKPVQRR